MKKPIITLFLLIIFTALSCAVSDENPALVCPEELTCQNGYTCIDGVCQKEEIDNPVITNLDQDPSKNFPDNGNSSTPSDYDNSSDLICEPNSYIGCDSENIHNIIKCSSDGLEKISKNCGGTNVCSEASGTPECITTICTPNQKTCDPNDLTKVFQCDNTGAGYEEPPVELCDSSLGAHCGYKGTEAACISLCDKAGALKSYQGCDYFAVNLHNETVRDDPIFSVVISNTSDDHPASIDITFTEDGTNEIDAGGAYFCINNKSTCQSVYSTKNLQIGSTELAIVMFPHDRMVKETGISFNSYHIKTSIPVTIYQFNPFDNSTDNPFKIFGSLDKSYTNDASLLIPSTSVGTDYVTAGFTSVAGVDEFDVPEGFSPAYVTIVGVSDNDVELKITPKETIKGNFGNGITEITAGTSQILTLKKHQVINLETDIDGIRDLTGTTISCNNKDEKCAPFAVFSGNVCTNIPVEYGYCDHIEQQLLPTNTWGKQFILVKSYARGEESDYVRIIAKEDNTTLTFSPQAPAALPPHTETPAATTLNASEFSEFYFKEPVTIKSDKPIMVVQYLTASEMLSEDCRNFHPESCVGDPAMMIIPPVEQFRSDYVFLTPGSYQSNYATIVTHKDSLPILNNTTLSNKVTIADSQYSYYTVELGDQFKRHTLKCSNSAGSPTPCGLIVYGWEMDVSYAYPGGLNLKTLIEE